MINLNTYLIENQLYSIGDTLIMGNDTIKIESIINVNETVFFFCSKLNGQFSMKIDSNTTLFISISPMPALSFHHLHKRMLAQNQ